MKWFTLPLVAVIMAAAVALTPFTRITATHAATCTGGAQTLNTSSNQLGLPAPGTIAHTTPLLAIGAFAYCPGAASITFTLVVTGPLSGTTTRTVWRNPATVQFLLAPPLMPVGTYHFQVYANGVALAEQYPTFVVV